jgi:hypothetical protein
MKVPLHDRVKHRLHVSRRATDHTQDLARRRLSLERLLRLVEEADVLDGDNGLVEDKLIEAWHEFKIHAQNMGYTNQHARLAILRRASWGSSLWDRDAPEEFRATAVVLARCVDDGLKAASAAAGHSGGSDRLSGEGLQTATTTPREAARKAVVSIHGPLRTNLG